MDNIQQFDLDINKSTSVSIVACTTDIDLDSGIWAINWFDTKRRWLYNLYTFIASRFVIKVGGKLWFKGAFVETLSGNKKDARKILLIVKYPTAHHFLDLVALKSFQMVSLLRILAVKRFVFGFTQRHKIEGLSEKRQDKGAPCLVHHFRNTSEINKKITSICYAASEQNIYLNYWGKKAATLKRSHSTEGAYDVPFIMDGILVFEAANRDQLMAFYKSETYLAFTAGLDNSYAAIFKKIA